MGENKGEGERTAPVVGLFGAEALIAKRVSLQQRLGKVSTDLSEVSREYNACINEIVAIDAALRAEGVDTNAIARDQQRDVSSGAAVNGNGRYNH